MQFQLILIAGFGAASFAVVALASAISDLFLFRREQRDARLAEEFGLSDGKSETRSPLFKDSKSLSDSGRSTADWRLRLLRLVEQSGLPLTLERALLLSVAISLTAFLAALSFEVSLLTCLLLIPVGP